MLNQKKILVCLALNKIFTSEKKAGFFSEVSCLCGKNLELIIILRKSFIKTILVVRKGR